MHSFIRVDSFFSITTDLSKHLIEPFNHCFFLHNFLSYRHKASIWLRWYICFPYKWLGSARYFASKRKLALSSLLLLNLRLRLHLLSGLILLLRLQVLRIHFEVETLSQTIRFERDHVIYSFLAHTSPRLEMDINLNFEVAVGCTLEQERRLSDCHDRLLVRLVQVVDHFLNEFLSGGGVIVQADKHLEPVVKGEVFVSPVFLGTTYFAVQVTVGEADGDFVATPEVHVNELLFAFFESFCIPFSKFLLQVNINDRHKIFSKMSPAKRTLHTFAHDLLLTL